jgi:putative flavoprotein involved in K+ transport
MRRTDTVIIGGGQAGLAISHSLRERAIAHVILERGRVAERWRSERWDSLRLLTPNWQSRLPGFRYQGPDPEGFMSMPEVVSYLERYRQSFDAPVEEHTTVEAVEPLSSGYLVSTNAGEWEASAVVIATGQCDVPYVPAFGAALSETIRQLVPTKYRNPRELPAGGVLVVGASSTGVQLADEIRSSGRAVTLAVSRHIRLPRRYRGKDILWWFDRMGLFDETTDDVYDVAASRRQPSLQLIGTPEHSSLDLPMLQERGVRLVGRVLGAEGSRVRFADDLITHTVAADAKLAGLLARIDEYVATNGLAGEVSEPEPFVPFFWPHPAPTAIDLSAERIETVLWATGFRREYPWLKVPVLDERGEIRHRGGITEAPGLYVLGLQFLRRRKSNFIDGVGDDAREIAEHLSRYLQRRRMALAGSREPSEK